MKRGDKILIVHKQVSLSGGHDHVYFRRARVVEFRFAKGACRFTWRTGRNGPRGVLAGKDRNIKWIPGWDERTPEANAILVVAALT